MGDIHTKGIKTGKRKNLKSNVIARKLYLCYPTHAFMGDEKSYDMQFDIYNEISEYFNISINSIKAAGSGQTGHSFYKNTDFNPGKSDLDIAIIDLNLFNRYIEIVYKNTNGLRDRSKFKDDGTYKQYCSYLAKGIFRPDLMPYCKERREWFAFFNKLSERYFELFKDINAGIYASQQFFEFKQAESLENIK